MTATTILGTSGNDTLNASVNGEFIDGQGGSDVLSSAGFTGVELYNPSGSNDVFTLNGNGGDSAVGSNAGHDTFSISGTGAGAADFIDAQQGGHDSISDGGGSSNVEVWTHGDVASVNPNGNETISLGNGADTVTTAGDHGSGHNLVTLGNGNDALDGFYSTGDTITTGSGNSTIYPGLGGGHNITVGTGNNLIMAVGSESGDTINATAGVGQDVINTGEGNNSISTNGHSIIYFTDGNTGHDTLVDGAAGGDLVSFFYSPNAVNLSLTDSSANATIGSHSYNIENPADVTRYYLTATSNDDLTLSGTHSYNVSTSGSILVGTGNDVINASADSGNDTLYGSSGNDIITSGSGSNIIDGQGGSNTIVTHGNDLVYSGTGGNNVITDNSPQDANTTTYDLSQDTLSYAYADHAVNLNLSNGSATIGSHTDTLTNPANFHFIQGSAFGDTMIGGGGSYVTITGGVGNDSISAGNATVTEWLFGGGGNNTIVGDGNNNGLGDELYGAGNGNNLIIGSGYDSANYFNSPTAIDSNAPINANLILGTVTHDGGFTDTLQGVHNIIGTVGNDTIVAGDSTASTNAVYGMGGNNYLADEKASGSAAVVYFAYNVGLLGATTFDDTISGFTSGSNSSVGADKIQILGDNSTFATSGLSITTSGANSVVTFASSSSSITVVGDTHLTASDFIFS